MLLGLALVIAGVSICALSISLLIAWLAVCFGTVIVGILLLFFAPRILLFPLALFIQGLTIAGTGIAMLWLQRTPTDVNEDDSEFVHSTRAERAQKALSLDARTAVEQSRLMQAWAASEPDIELVDPTGMSDEEFLAMCEEELAKEIAASCIIENPTAQTEQSVIDTIPIRRRHTAEKSEIIQC